MQAGGKMAGGKMARNRMERALMGKNGALRKLAEMDGDIAVALERIGPPPDRTLPKGFATLCRIIIGQQISTKAAAAVWRRMQETGLDNSQGAHAASIGKLRGAGLSKMKAEYVKGLADAVETGALDFDRLASLDGEEASRQLTALRGVGEWTADNYRLFVLLDMDAWPYNDLALQEGMRILKSLDTRPDGKAMAEMGGPWKPFRGAGALMLWHVYKENKDYLSLSES